ncbi:MAG: RNA polymerase sigma-70 factor [Tannerellaceae bacterium]|jgi:RNA polymerase sigma-70 factor (ECF subfamily)|nr:RNA polymerase sigma-70 factor [Tannerellaceae bacterium]
MTDTHFDNQSLGILFEQHWKPFISFANSYVKDTAIAEDICMEAFMTYWEKHLELPEETNMPAYILTCIKNRALNFLRNREARIAIQEKMHEHRSRELRFRITTLEACEPQELFSNEIKQLIHKTLQQLPDKTRYIFLKSRNDSKTNKEIASELGISIKTVEFHITKALKIFRTNLKDYLPLLLLFLHSHN